MDFTGLYRALVVDNADPEGLSRVRVQVPQIMGGNTSGWAYPVPSGVDVPAIGTQVWVGFEGGDPSFPLYYGKTAVDLTAINSHLTTLDGEVSTLNTHATTVDTHLSTIDGHLSTLDTEAANTVNLTGNQTIAGTKNFTGDAQVNGVTLVTPPGVMHEYAPATLPPGYLWCDGTVYTIAAYPALGGLLLAKYGGDGTTTFAVPDRRGRVAVGLDASQTEFNTLGKTGGEKTHVLTSAEMPGHTHTMGNHTHSGTSSGQSASHVHAVSTSSDGGVDHLHSNSISDGAGSHQHGATYLAGASGTATSWVRTNGSSGTVGGFSGAAAGGHNHTVNNGAADRSLNHNHTMNVGGASVDHSHTLTTGAPSNNTSDSTGAGGAHNNLQPYIAVNFIIKT